MKRRYRIMLLVLIAVFFTMGNAYGAEMDENTKTWRIPFLGTLQTPAQMEVIDAQDVLLEMIKITNKYPPKNQKLNTNVISPEEITAAFKAYNIGAYEFAIKNNGTYNIAFAFVGKVPAGFNAEAIMFFNKLQVTKKQQEEIHSTILRGIKDVYANAPELEDIWKLEILEFYPFEHITNQEADIIGVGGSMAIRSFKLIQPAAFKVYFINKKSEMFVFGVVNYGVDRKMWDNISKDMLSNAQWNDLLENK